MAMQPVGHPLLGRLVDELSVMQLRESKYISGDPNIADSSEGV